MQKNLIFISMQGILLLVCFAALLVCPVSVCYAMGFQGAAGKLSIVLPEGAADNTLGLGVVGDLGSVVPQVPELKGEVSADFWRYSHDITYYKWSWSSITFNGTAKYHFPLAGKMSPFAGGGVGLVFSRWSHHWQDHEFYWVISPTKNSDTDVDLGLHLVGGIDIPVGSNMKFTGELKYSIGGTDTFQISGAMLFRLQ